MRWCFFSPGYRSLQVLAGDSSNSGGAEAQVAHLAAALARLGNEVGLIYGDGKAQVQKQVIAGVTCIDAAPSWRRPSSLAAFWSVMNDFAPEQLYARLPSDFLWIMGLFARRRGIRFLYAMAHDLHCTPWSAYDYKRWFHAPLYALGLLGADKIAIQHEHQLQLVRLVPRDRLMLVPNLVRSTRSAPREYAAAKYDAIWVGNFRPEKQLGRYLDLAEAFPERRFALIGGVDDTLDAAIWSSLKARLSELKNISFLGRRNSDEVLALIAQSKVLINTSTAEGFPNTMLEAWSAGVPVVSLSVDPGGVIKSEGLGLVGGDRETLLRDFLALADSEALNRELGARGLAYVRRRHGLEAVCNALSQAAPGSDLVAPTLQTL